MRPRIRVADRNDLQTILDMLPRVSSKLASEGCSNWDIEGIDTFQVKSYIDRHYLYVFTPFLRRTPVGFYIFNELDDVNTFCNESWGNIESDWVFLHYICIDTLSQNFNYGRKIIKNFDTQAKELGYESIRTVISSRNKIACKLFEKLGYTKQFEYDNSGIKFFAYEKSLCDNIA